jgi:hypothetical protein
LISTLHSSNFNSSRESSKDFKLSSLKLFYDEIVPKFLSGLITKYPIKMDTVQSEIVAQNPNRHLYIVGSVAKPWLNLLMGIIGMLVS